MMPTDGAALRAEVLGRFVDLTSGSKRYAAAHRAHHADKSSIGIGFDPLLKEAIYPIVASRVEGAHLWDVDNNEYTDILQGLGTNLVGHNPAFIRNAIARQLDEGFPIGPQHPLVGELARLVTTLTGLPRACFSNTGTEAIMAAIRMARTASGRDRIALFSNSYHGHADPVLLRAPLTEYARRKISGMLKRHKWTQPLSSVVARPILASAVPAAPGIPAAVGRDVLVLDYGNPRSLDVIRAHRHKLAAVLVEPVQSRCPELQPVDFLHALRDLTAAHDIALIFDEMVTGFRLHPAGAQGLFGIRADIATYRKIAGGGLPLSVIAGSQRYLDAIDGGQWEYGDDSVPGARTTFFAGTFCKHPLALTAAHAMLSHLRQQGPELQQRLTERTAHLVLRLNQYTEDQDIPVRFTHSGSFFAIAMTQSRIEQSAVNLLSYLLLCEGIFLRPGDKGGFITTAHSEQDTGSIAAAFELGLARLRHANQL
jgi:glutamate-1-semialdehyde aminotransferase